MIEAHRFANRQSILVLTVFGAALLSKASKSKEMTKISREEKVKFEFAEEPQERDEENDRISKFSLASRNERVVFRKRSSNFFFTFFKKKGEKKVETPVSKHSFYSFLRFLPVLYFSWKEFIAFYSYFVVTVKLDSFK
jgi:hypothetical protein